VLVGAIERSRHPPVRAVLLLGFDEQHFPMRRAEDPLLGDLERDDLEQAGLEIGPSRQRQLLDERMLAYIALTRASERLWISYPRTASDGKPVEPSAYLQDVKDALPGLTEHRCGDPRLTRGIEGITRVTELAARMAKELRSRPRREKESDIAARSQWNAVYEIARQHDPWQHTLRQCLAGLAYRNEARLEAGIMERSLPSPLTASVSRLEKFAMCPFAHYANYTLGLEERAEAGLGHLDLGNICHAVLELFIKQLVDEKQRLDELEDDEIVERIDRIAAELKPRLADEMMLAEARNAYLFGRSRGHLRRVTQWQRDAARAGRYGPVDAERRFGYGDEDRVEITTPRGRKVRLHGYIDRVDVVELADSLGGMVIDYKTSRERKLNASEVYHGLAVQLVGYLLALQQAGQSLTGRQIRPVAAFYLPLLEGYERVAHPTESKDPADSFRLRGIMDMSALDGLDRNVQTSGKSSFMSASFTKTGEPHWYSDLARPEQFRALIAHVTRRMGQLADSLIDGNIAVRPYRLNKKMPCRWCAYRSVCRYESELQPANVLEPVRNLQDLLDRLAEDHPNA